jgi:hypothetical protein
VGQLSGRASSKMIMPARMDSAAYHTKPVKFSKLLAQIDSLLKKEPQ